MSKVIHHAKTSLIIPRDLKLLLYLKNIVKTPPKTQMFQLSSNRGTKLIAESKPQEELEP